MTIIYKALTLWQPWASLIIWGEKEIETRGWQRPYRGLLAIHAAKTPPTLDLMSDTARRNAKAAMTQHNVTLNALPLGAVLGIVELRVIRPIPSNAKDLISPKEFHFGDYTPGRYAWFVKVVEVFPRPIPAKGMQTLWDWSRSA